MNADGRTDRSAGEGPTHVVATAGHVDHGKSTLIRRLTGIDPDRLEEEKRRGLTIDLGFAWCTLPSGREIGFVDVPGHERFVRTMLAGVGPVRLVLFVVAADEGWKPQSEEHLAIVDVLGVDAALIAVTKADAVEAETLDATRRAIRRHVEATALAQAPIVTCSAMTGAGIEDLLDALDAMVASAPTPPDTGRPRLFVDRVFTMAGAGTVVTGTLTGGRLRAGDDVEIVPSGERARIRGLQTHRRRLEEARPVSRVAVNLAGLEREVVERGDVLGHVGDWPTTTTLEAWIERVRGLRHPLGSRGAFTLHVGSAEREVTIRVYGVDDVDEDGAFVRIRADRPVAIDVGDRFVLRESGRRETVAGGVVLDADPPSRPGRDAERRLAARASASRSELPALAVGERGVVRSVDADRLAGGHVERIDGAERIGEAWISRPLMAEIGAEVTSALDDDARDVAGIRSEVEALLRRRRLDAAGVATDIVERLVIDGTLTRDGARISRAGRRVARDDEDVTRLVDAIAAAEPTPPTVAELHARGLPIAALGSAVASGALVRLTPELVVTRSLVDRAIDEVRAAGAEGITVSALRQALGTSRRYAVPLMEHLDRIGETRRAGDLRFARGV